MGACRDVAFQGGRGGMGGFVEGEAEEEDGEGGEEDEVEVAGCCAGREERTEAEAALLTAFIPAGLLAGALVSLPLD